MISFVGPVTFAISGVLLALSSQASAQTYPMGGCYKDGPSPPFMSQESEIQYGCGYLFEAETPEPALALTRFRLALAKNPENAFALYLLGVSHAALNEHHNAREAIAKALRIDPQIASKLAARLAEQPRLLAQVQAALSGDAATQEPSRSEPSAGVTAPKSSRSSTLQPRAQRGAPPAETRAQTRSAQGSGAKLEFGTYACWHHSYVGAPPNAQRQSVAKGSITLRPNGTYKYLANGGEGRYRFNEATGAITWLSGPIAAMKPDETTFTREQTTSSIELRLTGDYRWLCGTNNR